MAFEYQDEVVENSMVISFKGRFVDNQLDRDMIVQVEASIDNGIRNFILDLKGLEYLNSTGINSLVKILALVNRVSGRVLVVSVPTRINELLEVIKLNSVFETAEDRDAGLTKLKNQQ